LTWTKGRNTGAQMSFQQVHAWHGFWIRYTKATAQA